MADGHVRVTAVPYDSQTMQVDPLKDEPIVETTGSFPAGIKGGPGFTDYAIFAYDATVGGQMLDAAGQPVVLGHGVGMK